MNQADCLIDPYFSIYKGGKHADLLRKIVIFKDLSDKSLRVIEKRIQTYEFKKGKQIIAEDEAAMGVYFVVSGAVKLTKQDENGCQPRFFEVKKGRHYRP